MKLVLNAPLDTKIIEEMIEDSRDLYLVWPAARIPFNHNQWKEALDPAQGRLSFIVHEDNRPMGHGALRPADAPDTYWVSYLYIDPGYRKRGLGKMLVFLLEDYATCMLDAKKLMLVVRTYNENALKCYESCGFKKIKQDDTLITMEKNVERQEC